jgi:hypothetical protein
MVTLDAVIGKDGTVQTLKVLGGFEGFKESAVTAWMDKHLSDVTRYTSTSAYAPKELKNITHLTCPQDDFALNLVRLIPRPHRCQAGLG